MPEADFRESGSGPVPAPARAQVSGARIALAVVIGLVTVALTLIMLVLALCAGIWAQGNHGDMSGAAFFVVLGIVIPVGGTWLMVVLLRTRRGTVVTGAAASSSIPAILQEINTRERHEIKERLMHLRVTILIAILAYSGFTFASISRSRTGVLQNAMLSVAVGVMPLIPYVIVWFGIGREGRAWPLSLALMYPIIALCFSTFSFVLESWWRYPAYASRWNHETLAYQALAFAVNAALIVFAWRAWKAAGKAYDAAARLAVCGVASALYFFCSPLLVALLFSGLNQHQAR
jgi:hypothetical protein